MARMVQFGGLQGETLPLNTTGAPFGVRDKGAFLGRGTKPEVWSNICKFTCAIQMVGGVFLGLLSSVYLFDYMMTTGMIIGALLFVIGAIGFLGSMKMNKDFLNFHIVGAILTIMLSFQFTGQVWREVEVDCALAELYLKSNAVEEITRKTAQNEMFDTIYNRINQMEDMLVMVHDGVKKSTALLSDGNPLADIADDRDFFHSKLDVLHRHASEMLQEIMENPNITKESVAQWKPEHKIALEQKLASAEKVLGRINEHRSDEAGRGINATEYEELLHAVTAAFLTPSEPNNPTEKDTSELAEAHDDLEETQDSITRLQSAVKNLDELTEDNEQVSKQLKERRAHWNTEYIKILQRSRQSQRNAHVNTLENMPEHCIKENTGIEYMGFAGLAVAVAQLVSIYFTLCLQFRIPLKME
eukprot:evm.model.scf_865.3 EVM.evm.TU.scf_865.3   scf_865:18339-27338(-)